MLTMNWCHKDCPWYLNQNFPSWVHQNSDLCSVSWNDWNENGLLSLLKDGKKKGCCTLGKTLLNSELWERHSPYMPISSESQHYDLTRIVAQRMNRAREFPKYQSKKMRWEGFQKSKGALKNNLEPLRSRDHRLYDPTGYVPKAAVLQWNGLLFAPCHFFPLDFLLFYAYFSDIVRFLKERPHCTLYGNELDFSGYLNRWQISKKIKLIIQ